MENINYCQELPLAIASVPMQRFEHLYPLDAALDNGTMFQALHLPFDPKEAGCDER